jgi:hypothetical protein
VRCAAECVRCWPPVFVGGKWGVCLPTLLLAPGASLCPGAVVLSYFVVCSLPPCFGSSWAMCDATVRRRAAAGTRTRVCARRRGVAGACARGRVLPRSRGVHVVECGCNGTGGSVAAGTAAAFDAAAATAV